MTVAELIARLQRVPQDSLVEIDDMGSWGSCKTLFVNSVYYFKDDYSPVTIIQVSRSKTTVN